MQNNRLKIILFSLGFVLIGFTDLANSLGREEWIKVEGDWIKPEAMTTFKDTVYLSAQDNKNGDSIRLWKSTNGTDWEAVTGLTGIIVQVFETDQDVLFALGIDDVNTPTRTIYRTTDGHSWSQIGTLGSGFWMDAEIHNSHLFFSGTTNSMWRVSLASAKNDANPLWELLTLTPNPLPIKGNMLPLASFQGHLYAAFGFSDNASGSARFMRSPDGLTWEQYPESGPLFSKFGFGFETSNDLIFYGGWTMMACHGQAPNFTSNCWRREAGANYFPSPMMVGGKIHVVGSSTTSLGISAADLPSTPRYYEPIGIQYFDVCPGIFRRYNNNTELGTMAFMNLCDVWMMKRGAKSFKNETTDVNAVSAGQENAILTAWSIDFNLDETLKYLRFKNLGNAESGQDIRRLRILKKIEDPRLINPTTKIVELRQTGDPLVWETPPGFELELDPSDIYVLAADVADQARDQRTIHFSIQGSKWKTNPDFSLNTSATLIMKEAQTIKGIQLANTQAPIDGAIVYPSPAKNTVHFLYDLSSASDVHLKLFDRNGTLVSEIADLGKPAGARSSTQWDSTKVAAGTYYAIIEILGANGEKRKIKKMIFIKR